jgi:hypothetical protein
MTTSCRGGRRAQQRHTRGRAGERKAAGTASGSGTGGQARATEQGSGTATCGKTRRATGRDAKRGSGADAVRRVRECERRG